MTEKHNHLILTIDLEKLDRILKKIHDEFKKGNVKIDIDLPLSITSKGLTMDTLEEFQFIKDDFEPLSFTPLESYSKDISQIKDTLLHIVKRIKKNFEDFRDRQLSFFQLKEALKSAKTDFQGEQHLLEVIICLFDAVKNVYAEDLSIEQVNVIEAIINELDTELTELDVDNITEKLITAGFNPLPRLDGLAEMYQRHGEL